MDLVDQDVPQSIDEQERRYAKSRFDLYDGGDLTTTPAGPRAAAGLPPVLARDGPGRGAPTGGAESLLGALSHTGAALRQPLGRRGGAPRRCRRPVVSGRHVPTSVATG